MALVTPVVKDGFSYAHDSFYCEAGSLNRHRRATLPELKAHFNGKGMEERPAHWYEAQLIHYGLPPSKVKGTAHKRLFDAVMKGGLTVPTQIQKIEADLKKEYNKKEREAKKALKGSAASPQLVKGTKRKADQVSTNVSVNVSVCLLNDGAIKPATKKPKTIKAPKTASTTSVAKIKKVTSAKATAATAAPKKKTAPVKPAAASAAAKGKSTTSRAPKASKPVAKSATASKVAKSPAKPKIPTKQAAGRRPGPLKSSNARTTGFALAGPGNGYNDAPPPYSEFDPWMD